MKRFCFAALLIVAVCLLAGCPPQKQDICPGFAHCAVMTWNGQATTVLRGQTCNLLSPLANVSSFASSYTDTTVVSGQSYCYAVSGMDGISNKATTVIP